MDPELKKFILSNVFWLGFYLVGLFGFILWAKVLFFENLDKKELRNRLTKPFSGTEKAKLWKARIVFVFVPIPLVIWLIATPAINLLFVLGNN